MRALVFGTFLVDGLVAVWLVASLAFGTGRLTPRDALILAALLLGFFTALGIIIESRDDKSDTPDAVN
jgi:hypothetical protein